MKVVTVTKKWNKDFQLKKIYKWNNADLKISLYVCIDIKVLPWKFRIFNPKNSRAICPWSL